VLSCFHVVYLDDEPPSGNLNIQNAFRPGTAHHQMKGRKKVAPQAFPPIDPRFGPEAADEVGANVTSYQLDGEGRRYGAFVDHVDGVRGLRAPKRTPLTRPALSPRCTPMMVLNPTMRPYRRNAKRSSKRDMLHP
jgi:hypothetical protein